MEASQAQPEAQPETLPVPESISPWQALTALPSPDLVQWQATGIITRWLIATRAAVLPLTGFACLFAAACAWPLVNPGLFALSCLGVMLAHATNNLINDHVDYLTGLDRDNYFRTRYGIQPIDSGLQTLTEHRRYIIVTGSVALLCGVVVVAQSPNAALTLLAAGAFFVLFYTYPLKHWALGEIAVWVVWGPLMVGSLCFVGSGQFNPDTIWLGALYGLGPLAVIFGKHTDKIADDRARNVTTLPTVLGLVNSRVAIAAIMLALPIGGIVWAALRGEPGYLLLALCIPMWLRTRPELFKPAPQSEDGMPLHCAALTFMYARNSGALITLAALLSAATR